MKRPEVAACAQRRCGRRSQSDRQAPGCSPCAPSPAQGSASTSIEFRFGAKACCPQQASTKTQKHVEPSMPGLLGADHREMQGAAPVGTRPVKRVRDEAADSALELSSSPGSKEVSAPHSHAGWLSNESGCIHAGAGLPVSCCPPTFIRCLQTDGLHTSSDACFGIPAPGCGPPFEP